MIQNVSCPDRSIYEGFLSGRLDDEQLNEVERHLADCEACGETVRAMRVDDTFLELLQQVGRAAPHAEDESLDPLLQQLEQLNETRGDALTSLAARRREVEALLQPTGDGELGRLGHYVLSRPLGAGGMGIVYQAEDTKLRRSVALKILRPSLGPAAKERFLHEARAAAAIENDNVVTIYDAGSEGGLAFLAMQWLDGETLEHRLQQRERLPANEVIDIAAQIAAGLAAAHEQKLIHRDIKPANIWLEADRDRTRLLDFGLARCLDDDILLTETGMIAGTPAYMSPEQAQGRAIDERSDLFSLGTLLYRMLTGRLPFESDNALAVITAIQQHQPASPRQLDLDVPNWLSDLVMDLLEKDPRDRPQRAADVAQSLRTEQRQYPVQPRQTPRPLSSGRGRSFWRWAATACLGFVAICASVFVYRIATDRGDLVVRAQDPNVQVEVLQGGQLVRIIDPVKQDRITLRAGTYELKLGDADGNFTLDRNKLTLVRNGVEVITVETPPPGDDSIIPQVDARQATQLKSTRHFRPELDKAFGQIREKLRAELAKTEQRLGEWQVRYETLKSTGAESPENRLAMENIADQISAMHPPRDRLRYQLSIFESQPQANGTIRPGQPIHINVAGTLAEAPIDGDYWVEANSGAVPLGALYGRVFVAGMTLEQAEVAIRQQLQTLLKHPLVQVTSSRSHRGAIQPQASAPTMVDPPISSQPTSPVETIRVVELDGNHAALIINQFYELFRDATIRLTQASDSRILAVGSSDQEFAQLEELVNKMNPPQRRPRTSTVKRTISLADVSLTPADLAACELRVVGIYSAKNHMQDDRVTIRVEATDKPLVLALSSYYATCWQLNLEEDATVKLVIVTHGAEATLVEGLPPNIPVLRLRRSDLYAYEAPHNNQYRQLAEALTKLTQLPVSTFQGTYQGKRFTVGGDLGRIDGLESFRGLKTTAGDSDRPLDKSALAGCELVYFGAEGADRDGDERVSLVIGPTEKPAVIVVGAYQETWWRFTFLPGANVKQIIVGGYYEQLVEGVPDTVPLSFKTYFPDHHPDYFFGHAPNTAEGRKTIRKLKELTGLSVEHFYTLERGQEFVLEPPAQ